MGRREGALSQWHPSIFLTRISLWGRRGGEEAKALREFSPQVFKVRCAWICAPDINHCS